MTAPADAPDLPPYLPFEISEDDRRASLLGPDLDFETLRESRPDLAKSSAVSAPSLLLAAAKKLGL